MTHGFYPYNVIHDILKNKMIGVDTKYRLEGKILTKDQIDGLDYIISLCTIRQQQIFNLRYKDEKTLDAIGDSLGITKEGVRQAINHVLKKISIPSSLNFIIYGYAANLEREKQKDKNFSWEHHQNIPPLRLSPRTYNALQRAGKTTIADLIDATEDELYATPNIGGKCVAEIVSKVSDFTTKYGDYIKNYSNLYFLPEKKAEEKKESEKPLPKKKEEKKKFVLIKTDGYNISTWSFENYEEGKREMERQYNSFDIENLSEDCAEMTYCSNYDATVYDNGDCVYVWKVVEV